MITPRYPLFYLILSYLFFFLTLPSNAIVSPAIYFEAPGPIIYFEATAIAPQNPDNSTIHHANGLWTGLATSNASVSLRNGIANQADGRWKLSVEYCCLPEAILKDSQNVNSGDQITTTILKASDSKLWNDIWTITSRDTQTGKSNTESAFISFDPDQFAPEGQDRFQLAVFAVEFETGQLWWSGPVAFIKIKIVAETQEAEWCNNPVMRDKRMPWLMSSPHAILGGMQNGVPVVTCCIERIIMTASWHG